MNNYFIIQSNYLVTINKKKYFASQISKLIIRLIDDCD